MTHEVNTVQKVTNGRRKRFSLQNVCETVAFECLQNDTNYFSKQKFPQQFWTRHLCDCRVLHEVHEVANFGPGHERAPSPVTSQCITPDSDSVHSSASSNFNSDVSSSNQSLASNTDIELQKTESLVEAINAQKTGPLLQVPQTHSDVKRSIDRPKTLSIEPKKQTTQTSGEIISFTSRCIRDFLASKRVCRYLQSDRDSESFIQRLIAKPQFYPVLRLTVRSLYISGKSDIILNLLDMLLTSQEFTNKFSLQYSPPRGPSPVLTSFDGPMIRSRLPHKYRVSNSDCPFRAKKEEQKQRRSSTSILGTCFEGIHELKTSSSFSRLLSNSGFSPFKESQSFDHRGYLEDYKEALIWLAETDNNEPYISAVSNRFPNILIISYQDCPSETIEHFICLVKRKIPNITEAHLYLSGFYSQWDLGLNLAQAIHDLTSVESLRISMKCVVDTSFLVDFICECFDQNTHTNTLHLEGPMNVAENITQTDLKRILKIFGSKMVGVKTLILDHYSYQHRVGYILNSLPNNFSNLIIKRSNLDSSPKYLNDKLSKTVGLSSLIIDNCYLPHQILCQILKHINDNVNIISLSNLQLNLISSSRRFNKNDSKKSHFKPSLNMEACCIVGEILKSSRSLKKLVLTNNGLCYKKARVILDSVLQSKALTFLDLSGNVISNDIEEDVIDVLMKSSQISTLLLGDNNITKQTRSAIIRESLSRNEIRLSL